MFCKPKLDGDSEKWYKKDGSLWIIGWEKIELHNKNNNIYQENGVINVRIFIALMIFNTIMIGCFSIAITFGGLTYYHIYVLRGNSISAHSLNMQRKLFLSVCAQVRYSICNSHRKRIWDSSSTVLRIHSLSMRPQFTLLRSSSFLLGWCLYASHFMFSCLGWSNCHCSHARLLVRTTYQWRHYVFDWRKGLLGMVWKRKHTTSQRDTISIPTIPTANSR